MITLMGDVEIDGETQSVITGMLGLDGQSADSKGRIQENVMFSEVDVEEVLLPDEFTLTIMGWYSQCEINKIVSWEVE